MVRKIFVLLAVLNLVIYKFGLTQKQLKGQQKVTDTTAIFALINSAYSFWNNNPKRGLELAEVALKKSTEVGFKKGQASAYRTQAVCYWSMGSYAPALDASFKGVKIAGETKDVEVRLNLENILALLFGDLGDIDQAIDTYKGYIKLIIEYL